MQVTFIAPTPAVEATPGEVVVHMTPREATVLWIFSRFLGGGGPPDIPLYIERPIACDFNPYNSCEKTTSQEIRTTITDLGLNLQRAMELK